MLRKALIKIFPGHKQYQNRYLFCISLDKLKTPAPKMFTKHKEQFDFMQQ